VALADLFQPPVPLQRPTLTSDPNPESRLTPGQRFGLQYSRDRYADNSYQIDAPHSAINPGDEYAITSFYGANAPAPGGGYINFPTYWGGKVVAPAAALANALAYEKQTGQQFARYPTQNAADWGEMQAVHPIMDQDAQQLLQSPAVQARIRAGR
jgi:hypothetical protein